MHNFNQCCNAEAEADANADADADAHVTEIALHIFRIVELNVCEKWSTEYWCEKIRKLMDRS